MSELSSSRDLHPDSGARFVFERMGAELRYHVHVYLPEQRSWIEGRARVLGPEPAGDERLEWARAELLKLARVLHRDPKPRLVRWRG
jgi:hypothetical protein